jgi:lipoyl(octanoyl) transferase
MAAAHLVYYPEPQPYAPIEALQLQWVAARIRQEIPDTVIFLQHEPVITLGRRGRTQHLLASPAELAAEGIALHQASRGGDVTYHAPGQLVIYPILRLGDLGADAHGYLFNLEELAIRTCATFGVPAFRVTGKNGAWTAKGKIAAIGFHIKRGITFHGMSFNVNLDLSGFNRIVPCGLVGDPVCSLETLLADQTPPLQRVFETMCTHFEDVFGRTLQSGSSAAEGSIRR